jgi:hypothetical protein
MPNYYLITLAVTLCCGCSHYSSRIDDQFGQAVRLSILMQISNRNAPEDRQLASTTDAQVVKSAIDRYQKSFDVLPPTTSVLNFGIGSNTSTNMR